MLRWSLHFTHATSKLLYNKKTGVKVQKVVEVTQLGFEYQYITSEH